VRVVRLPPDGIYRAGPQQVVDSFPEPAPALALTSPLCDGFRWEDVSAGFATIKCSRSAEAAIGRTIAHYRAATPLPSPALAREVAGVKVSGPPTRQGRGMIAAIKNRMSHPPDRGQPTLVEGALPPDVLASLYLLHIPGSISPTFVDLEHPSTRAALTELLGESLERLGLRQIGDSNLAREPDRRLTRLVLRALHDLCAGSNVAGVRIPGQPDEAWESFVVWSTPPLVDLVRDRDELRWVSPVDPDLVKAAKTLGLRLPYEPTQIADGRC
jgi:hypothetical protein